MLVGATGAPALLALLLATPAAGWTIGVEEPVDLFDPGALIARWSHGSNTSYTDGLKGGIAWALDPDLCDRLLEKFPVPTCTHDFTQIVR